MLYGLLTCWLQLGLILGVTAMKYMDYINPDMDKLQHFVNELECNLAIPVELVEPPHDQSGPNGENEAESVFSHNSVDIARI